MTVLQTLQKKTRFPLLGATCLCLSMLSLSACDLAKNQITTEREAGLEFQDYRDALATRIPDDDADKALSGTIPELQPYVSQTSSRMKAMPLVSISMDQTIPLRSALIELAQQVDYEIEIDPRIDGAIIFSAKDRPFDQVVARIADIAGLRYSFEDDVLRVELDEEYNKVYKIEYLSYIRSNKSGIRNNVAVVSGESGDSGSDFGATSESEANFWGELEVNLEQIVLGSQSGALKTRKTPKIKAAPKNPAVYDENGELVTPASDEVELNVESLDEGLDETEEAQGGTEEQPATFTINKQAGLISVYATQKAHKQVASYLQMLKKAVSSQVLIEAKVLEVTLSDTYSAGIDWSNINLPNGNLSLTSGATALTSNGNGVILDIGGNDIQSMIRAVSEFGTVKALASPRMTVLNNQSAVLNVATNRVFFDIDIDVTTDEGESTTQVDSEIRNVPEGVLINVQPSINLDDQTVSMAIRPSITKIIGDGILDPAVAFAVGECGAACADIESRIPELNVQEIDSVIQVRSGQPIVMGGLLQDSVTTNETGVPILSEAPIFGNLFQSHSDTITKTELVIFLEATILDTPSDSVHNTDKDLYRQFSSDRRPLRF